MEFSEKSGDASLFRDEAHFYECHERWIVHWNYVWPDNEDDLDDMPDAYDNPCGQCRFYVPL